MDPVGVTGHDCPSAGAVGLDPVRTVLDMAPTSGLIAALRPPATLEEAPGAALAEVIKLPVLAPEPHLHDPDRFTELLVEHVRSQ